VTALSFERITHPRYKFQLTSDYWHVMRLPLKFVGPQTDHIAYGGGVLLISKGYCWDGPSGPTVDTVDALQASLVHDALYQLIREGFLPQSFRREADAELYKIARREGMPLWRAAYWYVGLRFFGWTATRGAS